MSVLDQILSMRSKGMQENEIVSSMREQGVSPKEISDALSQAKIKEAVNAESGNEEELMPSIMGPERAESLPTEGEISDEDLLPPIPASVAGYQPIHVVRKEISDQDSWPSQEIAQEETQAPQPNTTEYYNQQETSPETYKYYYEEPLSQGMPADADTIIEISEQVFSEKIKIFQKQLESLNEFKVLAQTKIENISERLKRIESSIDALQSEILEKVGSYGRGIDSIKKEMNLMQESFGKIASITTEKPKQASKAKKR